jgi:pimeloyl-ACP methyl ester carboxylesterase
MTRMLCSVRTPDGGADPADMAAFFADDGRGFVDRMPEPDGLPGWLTQDELDHYIAEFSRTGFTGGINWYRNMDRNWSLTEQLAGAKVEVPSLFVGGTNDPVLVMSPPSSMDGWLTDHRGTVLVEGAGHWVQQERPDVVNDALLTFLDSIPTRKGSATS